MKRAILFCALLALLMGTNAQETTNYKEKHPYKDWVKIAPKLDDAFFTTPEAIRIADNVLLYQHTTGGWPKNVYMPSKKFYHPKYLRQYMLIHSRIYYYKQKLHQYDRTGYKTMIH